MLFLFPQPVAQGGGKSPKIGADMFTIFFHPPLGIFNLRLTIFA